MVVRVYSSPHQFIPFFSYRAIIMKTYEKNGEFGKYQSTENYSAPSLTTYSCDHSTQEGDSDK